MRAALPRRLAPLTFALALTAASPSLQWCAFTWSDCWAAAEAGDCSAVTSCTMNSARMCTANGPRSDVQRPCAAGADSRTASRSDDSKRTCTAGADPRTQTSVSSASCPSSSPDSETAPASASDRAWCVKPPANGVAARTLEMPLPIAPLVLAAVFDPARLQPPARAVVRPPRRIAAPARQDAQAPPRSRAPPIGFPSNLF